MKYKFTMMMTLVDEDDDFETVKVSVIATNAVGARILAESLVPEEFLFRLDTYVAIEVVE